MFKVDDSTGNVYLTRGDTARFIIDIKLDDEKLYEIHPNDVIKMTVRKKTKGSDVEFQKVVIGSNEIHIEPTDTSNMDYGKYKYDVELTTSDGDVYTIITPDNKFFKIEEETTY